MSWRSRSSPRPPRLAEKDGSPGPSSPRPLRSDLRRGLRRPVSQGLRQVAYVVHSLRLKSKMQYLPRRDEANVFCRTSPKVPADSGIHVKKKAATASAPLAVHYAEIGRASCRE